MNRNLTIIISVVVVIALMATWLYLLFFSNPSSDSQEAIEGSGEFTEFGEFGEDAPNNQFGSQNNSEEGIFDQNTVEDAIPNILRQLTTKNVIGYTETILDGETYIIFMESGVGHIYRINMETNTEERVTVTTIPDAREAVFTSDASSVVVKTGNSTGINDIIVGTINFEEKTVETTPLAEQVSDFTITSDDVLLYAQAGNSSSIVQMYDFEGSDSKVIFSTPFREAKIIYGTAAAGPHYYYPKTNSLLEGFIYEVINGNQKRLPFTKFGLSAKTTGNHVVISHRDSTALTSTIYDEEVGEISDLSISVIPDKCVYAKVLYCGRENAKDLRYNSVDQWLKGVETFSDDLIVVYGDSYETVIDIQDFSGRQVDVIDNLIGKESQDWYFRNKNDNTLWVYELSRNSDNNN